MKAVFPPLVALVIALSCAVPESASAQSESEGPPHGAFGLGAEATLTGLTGVSFVYDPTPWRLDFLFGYSSAGDGEFAFGGRFIWVLHSTRASDFGVGPGFGMRHLRNDDPDEDDSLEFHLEGLAQLRAFVVSNVALSGAIGMGIVLRDDEDGDNTVGVGGQLVGAAGLTYFF